MLSINILLLLRGISYQFDLTDYESKISKNRENGNRQWS